MPDTDVIDPAVPPSGTGSSSASRPMDGGSHLRRCALCGHIGCCDTSPSQHATAHVASSGHPVVQSFEPDEDWFFDYASNQFAVGPPLAEPTHHPIEQPVPGPDGRVPPNWEQLLNE